MTMRYTNPRLLCFTLLYFGLALSSEGLCVFGLHGAVYIYIFKIFIAYILLSLSFGELSLVGLGLALDMVD